MTDIDMSNNVESSRSSCARTALGMLVAVGVALALPVPNATAGDNHLMMLPDDIEWSPGPPSVPEGIEAAVLYGNPGEDGLFALRLKMPAGYHLPPHTHPQPEVVTVVSGTIQFGMGPDPDPDATQEFGPGSFIVFDPGTAHYVYTEEEVVIQLNSTGPWALNYVNPEDDPRNQ